jgi:hypothetical protein
VHAERDSRSINVSEISACRPAQGSASHWWRKQLLQPLRTSLTRPDARERAKRGIGIHTRRDSILDEFYMFHCWAEQTITAAQNTQSIVLEGRHAHNFHSRTPPACACQCCFFHMPVDQMPETANIWCSREHGITSGSGQVSNIHRRPWSKRVAIKTMKKIVVKMKRLECWYHRDQQRRKS